MWTVKTVPLWLSVLVVMITPSFAPVPPRKTLLITPSAGFEGPSLGPV